MTWHTIEMPVLLEVARELQAGTSPMAHEVATVLNFDEEVVHRTIDGLVEARYLNRRASGAPARMSDSFERSSLLELTERGRRTVGLWPNETAASAALVELLTQAADQVDDEDDASALRRAGRLLSGVPGNVVGGVITALIKSQTGI